MKLLNPIKISFKNLMAAKFRSFLTILGIIIGVASVILIVSIGQSAQALILDQINNIGSNIIGINPGASDSNGPPPTALGISITTLTYDDLQAIRDPKEVPEIKAAAGYAEGVTTVSRDNNDYSLSYIGTTASDIDVENLEMASGRFFDQNEETDLSRVTVIGPKVAEDLFGTEDPIGQKIKVNKETFTVIGIFKSRGAGIGASLDEEIYLPLFTAQKLILGINYLIAIRLKTTDPSLNSQAISDITSILRERHNIKKPSDDDFSIVDESSAIAVITKVTNILRYFILSIGALSLLVGGVGIMNIMLIAANQRIREIGTRKAVGARNSDIMTQFLVESATVSLIGGIIGIIFGIFTSYLVSVIAQALGYDWPLLISLESILIAVGISILIGIIFGLFPARRASKISPMEALRYE